MLVLRLHWKIPFKISVKKLVLNKIVILIILSTWVAYSDSHNWVQMISIPVLLLASSQDWTCNLQNIGSLEA